MPELTNKKILVIHGPNMNLIGIRSSREGTKLTLDKIDRALRRKARELDVSLKILQTHDETKAVTFLQRNRNKAMGVIISPTSWHQGGYTLADTLRFLQLSYYTVSIDKTVQSLFDQNYNVYNSDPIKAYIQAIESLIKIVLN